MTADVIRLRPVGALNHLPAANGPAFPPDPEAPARRRRAAEAAYRQIGTRAVVVAVSEQAACDRAAVLLAHRYDPGFVAALLTRWHDGRSSR